MGPTTSQAVSERGFSGTTYAAYLQPLTNLKVATTVLIQRPDIRLSNVLAGLSYALDLTEGQREGHAIRSCLIGMRIAR